MPLWQEGYVVQGNKGRHQSVSPSLGEAGSPTVPPRRPQLAEAGNEHKTGTSASLPSRICGEALIVHFGASKAIFKLF